MSKTSKLKAGRPPLPEEERKKRWQILVAEPATSEEKNLVGSLTPEERLAALLSAAKRKAKRGASGEATN